MFLRNTNLEHPQEKNLQGEPRKARHTVRNIANKVWDGVTQLSSVTPTIFPAPTGYVYVAKNTLGMLVKASVFFRSVTAF